MLLSTYSIYLCFSWLKQSLSMIKVVVLLVFSIIFCSVVTVAGICNSIGGGVLFDIPPLCRCWWWVQYAPCIADQSSVLFPSPHVSSRHTCQPPPPLLIMNNTMFYDAMRSSPQLVARSRRRWPRSTVHKSTDRTSSPWYKIPVRCSAIV